MYLFAEIIRSGLSGVIAIADVWVKAFVIISKIL